MYKIVYYKKAVKDIQKLKQNKLDKKALSTLIFNNKELTESGINIAKLISEIRRKK